jgi:hypothetical protein
MAMLAGLARGGLARRTVGAALEARIAAPSTPALGDQQRLTELGQVAEGLRRIDVADDRTLRHVDEKVCAGRAGPILTGAATTMLGTKSPPDAKVYERVDAFARDQVDAATVTAVTAVWTAARNELLAPKTNAAVAAAAGFDTNVRFVDKFHSANADTILGEKTVAQKKPRFAGLPSDSAARRI